MTQTLIRVILVDDHRHTHDAVAGILATAQGIELVAQGSNGEDALLLCEQYQPDLILMDVVMPNMDGIETTQIIRERFPAIKVLVLSSFQDYETIFAMLQSGAHGYVVKGALVHDLVSAIRATVDGNVVFSPEVTAKLIQRSVAEPASFGLTARELEVLRAMSEGLNNTEIGTALTISPSTVKYHVTNILSKMGANSRSEALVIAAKGHLL